MTAGLRIGFAVSALVHVAVAAAFWRAGLPSAGAPDDAPQPIVLQLAMFQSPPATPMPTPSGEVTETTQPPIEPELPMPEVAEVEPEDPPVEPMPVAREPPVEPQLKPRVVERPKPKPRKVAEVAPRRPVQTPPRPAVVTPSPAPAAAQVASVTASVRPTPVVDSRARQHYLAELAATIDRSKYYPRASRRRGEEGRVVVRFVIQKDGRLTDLAIAESSGHRRLDEAALQTLQRVTPFQPIPSTLNRDSWSISVPIAFSLRG